MRFESEELRGKGAAPIPKTHECNDTFFDDLGRSRNGIDRRADETALRPTVIFLRGRRDSVLRPAQPFPLPRPQGQRSPAVEQRLGHASSADPNFQPTGWQRRVAGAISWVVGCLIEGFAMYGAGLCGECFPLAGEWATCEPEPENRRPPSRSQPTVPRRAIDTGPPAPRMVGGSVDDPGAASGALPMRKASGTHKTTRRRSHSERSLSTPSNI
jgi:hypothetical protein